MSASAKVDVDPEVDKLEWKGSAIVDKEQGAKPLAVFSRRQLVEHERAHRQTHLQQQLKTLSEVIFYIGLAEALEEVSKIYGVGHVQAVPPQCDSHYPPLPPLPFPFSHSITQYATICCGICAIVVLLVGAMPFTIWDEDENIPRLDRLVYWALYWVGIVSCTEEPDSEAYAQLIEVSFTRAVAALLLSRASFSWRCLWVSCTLVTTQLSRPSSITGGESAG